MLVFVESGFLHFFTDPNTPFYVPSNHYPGTVLHKEIILSFHVPVKGEKIKGGPRQPSLSERMGKTTLKGRGKLFLHIP